MGKKKNNIHQNVQKKKVCKNRPFTAVKVLPEFSPFFWWKIFIFFWSTFPSLVNISIALHCSVFVHICLAMVLRNQFADFWNMEQCWIQISWCNACNAGHFSTRKKKRCVPLGSSGSIGSVSSGCSSSILRGPVHVMFPVQIVHWGTWKRSFSYSCIYIYT